MRVRDTTPGSLRLAGAPRQFLKLTWVRMANGTLAACVWPLVLPVFLALPVFVRFSDTLELTA